MNNMKLIGVGLEMWRKNAVTGRYPGWDMPGFDGTSSRDLNPWCRMIGMVYPFTPEIIEANRDYLESGGMPPEDFSKTVDSMDIFRCPADHPHPHRINQERSDAWAFNPYEYSYTINVNVVWKNYHSEVHKQVLSADGLWPWGMNLSGIWVDDPSAGWNHPSWLSNTVGYWHREGGANFLLRDTHVETHRYPPDTNEIFFGEPGESLHAFY